FEPRDHAQQGRLAAAGGADEHDELAALDAQVQRANDFGVAEALGDVLQVHGGHVIPVRSYPLTAPAVRPATRRRWNTSTSTISGTVTRADAAMMLPQGSSYSLAPVISAMATGTVRWV